MIGDRERFPVASRKGRIQSLIIHRFWLHVLYKSINESINQTEKKLLTNNKSKKARWPDGKASDSRAKGRGSILTEWAMLCP